MASRIIGCGGYLPEKILTNDDLAKFVDTNDEWIRTRTGITQRHIAGDDEFSSDMAYKAAIAAIDDAGIEPSQIDLVIVSTTTPDNSFPSVASKLHGYLHLDNVPSFDIQAVCSGFIYGLQIADSMIKTGKYRTILLVCAEKMSSLLDWKDRSTCVLFGDGAGAVVLQDDNSSSGVIDSVIYSDGAFNDILYTDGGIGTTGTSGFIRMKGSKVFKLAVEKMSESVQSLLRSNNLNAEDVTYLIPHQANLRIINSIASSLNIAPEKLITTIQTHANCSAASIPLALATLKANMSLKSGDILLITSFGAGITWGASLIKW